MCGANGAAAVRQGFVLIRTELASGRAALPWLKMHRRGPPEGDLCFFIGGRAEAHGDHGGEDGRAGGCVMKRWRPSMRQ